MHMMRPTPPPHKSTQSVRAQCPVLRDNAQTTVHEVRPYTCEIHWNDRDFTQPSKHRKKYPLHGTAQAIC